MQLLELVTVYETVTVPADTPVRLPDGSMVAMAGLLLLHIPPAVASVKMILFPTHTEVFPVITATIGKVFTVMGWVTTVVQLLELATV